MKQQAEQKQNKKGKTSGISGILGYCHVRVLAYQIADGSADSKSGYADKQYEYAEDYKAHTELSH